MINTTITTTTSKIAIGIMTMAALALIAFPALSQAATYAYVNQSGEVSMVVANDPMTAIAIAPNRAVHSGVMLLTQPDMNLVGDNVSGI